MLIDFEFQETYLMNLAVSMLLGFPPKSLPLATKTIPRDYIVYPSNPLITVRVPVNTASRFPIVGGGGQILFPKDCQATVERQSPRLTAASSSSHLGFENRVDTNCSKGLSVSIRQICSSVLYKAEI